MKAKREHRVPLCRRAVKLLDAARTLGDDMSLVFPMRSGRPIAPSTLPKMLQHHKIAAVAHGFWSSFRDWAAEKTDHPRGASRRRWHMWSRTKAEAAYARSDLFERRRRLMDDWSAYLASEPREDGPGSSKISGGPTVVRTRIGAQPRSRPPACAEAER